MEPRDIGKRIRQVRKRAGMGLRELARSAGLSPAALSAIEKGASSPTLATLHKVLKAMRSDFTEFFSGDSSDPCPAFPAADMRTIEDAHRRYVLMFPNQRDLRFEMIHETIHPSERRSQWEVHDIDLGGHVLEGGPARLEVDKVGAWTLRAGDAFYIRAGQRHRLANLGVSPLKLITVADPPRY
jgi:transcriptional regulator with XRE-family HTH domain